jgi:hypothetical protein
MPEHAQPPLQFAPMAEFVHRIVDANELVVLRDDLAGFLEVENKVLNIIKQLGRRAQASDGEFQAGLLSGDFLAIDFFFFILNAQPGEKMLPLRGDAADTRFNCVGEDAKGVGQEQLRDFLLIGGEVVVECGTELDIRILQLDKHQRDAVHI